MLEQNQKVDYDTVLREARELRSQYVADLARSLVAFFSRKPAGAAVKA